MAEEVDLQRLIVSFEANQKQFNSQLEKIDRKLAGTTRSMERNLKSTASASAALSGAFRSLVPAVSLAALLKMGRHALDVADKIDKLAISTGLSRERIQTLSFAADQLGVGADTATKGFERFSRALGEFKNTGAGPAAQALDQLGLANKVLSGELPDTESALNAVITALDGVTDSQQQAALAAKLFGDEVGPKFARLLASGADGLKKLEDQARSLGLVMSDELIAKSVEARDKLDALSAVVSAKATIAFAELAPVIIDVTDAIFAFIEASTKARSDFGQFIDDVAGGTETLRNALNGIRDALSNNIFTGPTIRFLTNPVNDTTVTTGVGLDPNAPNLLPPGSAGAGGTPEAIAKFNASRAGATKAGEKQRDVLGEINRELEREIRNLQFQATLVGKSEAEVSRLTAAHEKELALQDALAQAAEAGIALSPQQVEALRARLGAVEDLTVGLDNLNRLEEESKKAAEDAKRAAEEVAQAQQDVANGALDAAEAIAAAAKGTQSWEEALIQLLRIFLQLQQSGALGMFFGGGGVTLSNSGNAFGAAGSLFNGNGSIALPGNSSGLGFLGSASQGLLGDYFGIGDIFGGLFGGFRASGGPVQAGRAYMVGENGPEPFIPSVPGRIVSRGQSSLMRSDPTQNITFNVTTPDVIGFQRSKAAIAADLRRASRQAAGRG